MNEKSYENILVYDISFNTFIGERQLRISFDKVDGDIKLYDGYLVLLGLENRIRYVIQVKKVALHMFLLIIIQESKLIHLILCFKKKKILTLHDVTILIKSVFNKNQNHYDYNTFLEKCSYQSAKN